MWCRCVNVSSPHLLFSLIESNDLWDVGYNITPEHLYSKVTSYISSNAVTGWSSLSSVIGNLKATPELRWANPLELKNTVERAFTDTFGAKEAAPKAKPKVKTKKKTSPPSITSL
jgi:glutaminyl-tRNA synthetase